MNLNDAAKQDYNQVRSQLKLHFRVLQLPSEYTYPALSKMIMSDTDTMQKFYERLSTYAVNHKVPEEILKAFFLSGLPSVYKTYVTIRQPHTIADTLKLALEAEEVCVREDKTLNSQIKEFSQQLKTVMAQKTTAALIEDKQKDIDHRLD